MDQELKAKWVLALRSGKYRQAQRALIDAAGGLCCLGVLQVVCTGEKPSSEQWGEGNQCPELIRDELRVSIQNTLARMNDGGKTFTEIADYIEKEIV